MTMHLRRVLAVVTYACVSAFQLILVNLGWREMLALMRQEFSGVPGAVMHFAGWNVFGWFLGLFFIAFHIYLLPWKSIGAPETGEQPQC